MARKTAAVRIAADTNEWATREGGDGAVDAAVHPVAKIAVRRSPCEAGADGLERVFVLEAADPAVACMRRTGHQPVFWKSPNGWSGSGSTTTVLFSLPMLATVCRKRSCTAEGCSSSTAAASRRRAEAWNSPSA